MNSTIRAAVGLALATGLLAACASGAPSPESRNALIESATAAMQAMNRVDPGVEAMARKGYGYIVFPEVVKAGLGFGGGHGYGVVYEQGQHVGFADLTLASVGAQIGGQTFSELIVFENKAAMDRFKAGPLDFTAGAGGDDPAERRIGERPVRRRDDGGRDPDHGRDGRGDDRRPAAQVRGQVARAAISRRGPHRSSSASLW